MSFLVAPRPTRLNCRIHTVDSVRRPIGRLGYGARCLRVTIISLVQSAKVLMIKIVAGYSVGSSHVLGGSTENVYSWKMSKRQI